MTLEVADVHQFAGVVLVVVLGEILPEPCDTPDQDRRTHNKDRQIAVPPFEFRHVDEVHSVPTRDQRQRHEDHRHDRQQGHDPVHADVQLCREQLPQLHRVVPEGIDLVHEPHHSLCEQAEIAKVLIFEESVLVLLQFLAKIQQLLIVDPHIHKKCADVVELIRIFLKSSLEDLVLDQREFLLRRVQEPQVSGDERFQEVIEEPLQRGKPPSLAPADLLHYFGGVFAVLDKDDALLIQRERRAVGISGYIRAAGHIEGPRQGVKVDDRFRLQHIGRVQVHVDEHVELVLRPVPGLRVRDDDVGRIAGLAVNDVLHGAGGERFFDLVVHFVFP